MCGHGSSRPFQKAQARVARQALERAPQEGEHRRARLEQGEVAKLEPGVDTVVGGHVVPGGRGPQVARRPAFRPRAGPERVHAGRDELGHLRAMGKNRSPSTMNVP
jgi:hypothetical protein